MPGWIVTWKTWLPTGLVVAFFCFISYFGACNYLAGGSVVNLAPATLNALFAVLTLIRRPAQMILLLPTHWMAGCAGTLMPMLFRQATPTFPMLGAVVQIVGLALIFAALCSLRRSMGILPANRGIQVGGLYRFVRHPLYSAELLLVGGFVLTFFSLHNLLLALTVAGVQVWRSILEERVLLADPIYQKYSQRVCYRLIPGIF